MKPAIRIDDSAGMVTVDVDAFQKHGCDFVSFEINGLKLLIKRSDKWLRRDAKRRARKPGGLP